MLQGVDIDTFTAVATVPGRKLLAPMTEKEPLVGWLPHEPFTDLPPRAVEGRILVGVICETPFTPMNGGL